MSGEKNTRWENQYKSEVKTLSQHVLEEHRGIFDESKLSKFQDQKSTYSQVALEIGSGSGMHLLNFAEQNPSICCIGAELRYKRTVKTVEKGLKRNIHNILMIRGDIKNALSLIKVAELSHLFIHFPDPWEKARWRKHRLIQEPLLTELISKLTSKGIFSFRTDHQEYYEEASQLLTKHPQLSVVWESTDLFNSKHAPQKPSSEFESLFVSKNQPIGACLLHKLP